MTAEFGRRKNRQKQDQDSSKSMSKKLKLDTPYSNNSNNTSSSVSSSSISNDASANCISQSSKKTANSVPNTSSSSVITDSKPGILHKNTIAGKTISSNGSSAPNRNNLFKIDTSTIKEEPNTTPSSKENASVAKKIPSNVNMQALRMQ